MRKDSDRRTESATSLGPYAVPDYIAFDLETTGLSPEDDEILEIAMVRFQSGKPVERWSTLLNPGRSVPLKALRLTHIQEDDLRTSPVFADVTRKIAEFRGSLPLVGHNSSFDAAFLSRRIPGFPGVPVYDTLELTRIAIPGFKSYKLTDLARELGVDLHDAHRAYDDAEVSGVIFAVVQERIRSLGRLARERASRVMGKEWEPRRIFLFDEGLPPALPLSLERPVPKAGPGDAASDVPLPSSCGDDIADRFKDFLISAPVRSVAVNVPLHRRAAEALVRGACRYARESGQRVLLAGFPDAALTDEVRRLPVPGDYLCLRRFGFAMDLAEAGAYSGTDPEERRFLASLAVWADATDTGCFSEIQVAGTGYGVVSEVACPKGMECRHTCPSAGECYYLQAEAGLAEPPVCATRLDRASASDAASAAGRFDRVLVWCAQDMHRAWQYSEERADLGFLRECLAKEGLARSLPALESLIASAGRDLSQGEATSETKKLARDVAEAARALARGLRRSLMSRFASTEEAEADEGEVWKDPPLLSRNLHFIERAAEVLTLFASPPDGRMSVVESSYGDEAHGPFLAVRSVWPGKEAVRALESRYGPVVLLSDIAAEALSSEGGRRLMGIDAAEPSLNLWGDDKASLAVVTLDAKVPAAGQAFVEHLANLIEGLSLRLRKGLLVLFPSRAMLKDLYGALAAKLEERGTIVYAQGVDGGRRVTEHLVEDDAVVFATFGAAPGDDEPVPSCLVVAKVPFPPPNPVDDARKREVSQAGADGFVEVSVRPAALAIRSYAAKMLAAGGRRALVFGDPRLAPGQSKWAADFFEAFGGLPRESCPVQYAIGRVSGHLSLNSAG